jgi:hypothetical protein
MHTNAHAHGHARGPLRALVRRVASYSKSTSLTSKGIPPTQKQPSAGNAVIRNAPSPQAGLDIAISRRQLHVAHPLEHIRECRGQPFALLEGEGKLSLEPEALLA